MGAQFSWVSVWKAKTATAGFELSSFLFEATAILGMLTFFGLDSAALLC